MWQDSRNFWKVKSKLGITVQRWHELQTKRASRLSKDWLWKSGEQLKTQHAQNKDPKEQRQGLPAGQLSCCVWTTHQPNTTWERCSNRGRSFLWSLYTIELESGAEQTVRWAGEDPLTESQEPQGGHDSPDSLPILDLGDDILLSLFLNFHLKSSHDCKQNHSRLQMCPHYSFLKSLQLWRQHRLSQGPKTSTKLAPENKDSGMKLRTDHGKPISQRF